VSAASLSIGVTCGLCGADLGDQSRPGDGLALFVEHANLVHADVRVVGGSL
jgi:hypothetical protein